MKKLAVIGAAFAAAFSFAGVAHAQSGHVGLSYTENDDLDTDSTALSGAVALGSNFQLDGRYANVDGLGGDADDWSVGGHVFTRNSSWLLGGYAGYSNLDGGGTDLDEWTIAAEGQYYLQRGTISGALSYTEAEFLADAEQIGLDVEYRHFFTDNFSAQINANVASVDFDGGGDDDLTGVGVGAEWQLASMPLSIYGGYQHNDGDILGDSDTLGLGVRWNFGGGTLKDRSQSGAGLNRPTSFYDHYLGDVSPR
ncbi:MAG: hypothetical protein R3C16_03850 [Hyphomonadaceae bacterium]